MDLNPVFARPDGATAADVRIVLDFDAKVQRYRPNEEQILNKMNRIMKPEAVAVIGASTEDGKIGNSVMKNLINGGYKGQIYPVHPKLDEHPGLQGLQERQGHSRQHRYRRLRDPGQVRGSGADGSAVRRASRAPS